MTTRRAPTASEPVGVLTPNTGVKTSTLVWRDDGWRVVALHARSARERRALRRSSRGLAPAQPSRPVGRESYPLIRLSVLEQLREDAIKALKAGEHDLAGALRLVVSELQKDVKDGDGDELAVLRREHKRRLEAATQFQNANRPDLAHKETAEAQMIAQYLPPDLSDEQLSEIVSNAISQTGASTPKDMGAVMKVVMEQAGGLVDGKRASSAVRTALSA